MDSFEAYFSSKSVPDRTKCQIVKVINFDMEHENLY